MVGFETFRLLARSADVVGVRASMDAMAYRVVSPSARKTDSALMSFLTGIVSAARRASAARLFAAATSRAIGKYSITLRDGVSYFAHSRRVLNPDARM